MNININIGLPWIMVIIFTGLKLCGIIDWSWWWVTAPVWGAILVGVGLTALTGIYSIFTRSKKYVELQKEGKSHES